MWVTFVFKWQERHGWYYDHTRLHGNKYRDAVSQKEQCKSMVFKISERDFPESKNQIEQAEKLYEENIGGMVEKTREMVGSSIERNIETTLTFEKEWLNKLRENYTSGVENLRKQYDLMMSLQPEQKEQSSKKSPLEKPKLISELK